MTPERQEAFDAFEKFARLYWDLIDADIKADVYYNEVTPGLLAYDREFWIRIIRYYKNSEVEAYSLDAALASLRSALEYDA